MCLCMYRYIHVHVFVFLYVQVYVCIYVCGYICVCMCMCVHLCLFSCVHLCMCLWLFCCVHIYVYTCLWVFSYVHCIFSVCACVKEKGIVSYVVPFQLSTLCFETGFSLLWGWFPCLFQLGWLASMFPVSARVPGLIPPLDLGLQACYYFFQMGSDNWTQLLMLA